MSRAVRPIAIVALCLLTGSLPAAAQTFRPERPYRGVFGSGVADPGELLTVTGLAGAGYDDNIFAEQAGVPGATDERLALGGHFRQFGAHLNYSLNRTRVTFGATLASSVRHFPDLDAKKTLATHVGTVGATFELNPRTRLTASQSVGYQPFVTLGLFPELAEPGIGAAEPVAQDVSAGLGAYLSYGSAVSFSRRLTRRLGLEFGYDYQLTDFEGAESNFTAQRGNGRLTYELARGLGARMGYGYSQGQLFGRDAGRGLSGHNLDLGVDFNRALSFSRRTTLGFGTGTAATKDRGRTFYRIIGHALLAHEVGRTWIASVAYSRNVEFVPAFSEPFLGDAVSVGLKGMVSRRVEVESAVGTSVGNVGLSQSAGSFGTHLASSKVTIGLSRHFALRGTYSFYRYSFDSGILLPEGVVRERDRNAVQVEFLAWKPLIYRARRPNVTR